MGLDKKRVVTSFIGLGALYLIGAGGFSLIGALATSGVVGAIGYGFYEALKDGGWQLNSGVSYHHSVSGRPSVVVVEEHHHHRPQRGFWPSFFNFGGSMYRGNSSVHQTGSRFIPAAQSGSNVRPTGSTFVPANSHVHQTGSSFLPAFSGYGQSSSSVRQTGTTFVPATTSGSSIRQTGSTFRPA
ncbi:MAG: hypothetical protein U1E78_05275 [Gammaproteobacteria bacterium]